MNRPRKFWMRWRVRAGYPLAVIYWLLARPEARSIAAGAAAAILGLAVRAASSGYLQKDRSLATAGPYAHTRNPLYLGSALIAAGFAVAGHSWSAAVLLAVYFAVFYYAVMRNEEEDLRERFGRAYKEYAARVPLFFPSLFAPAGGNAERAGQPPPSFSWAQYRRNREYRAAIGTLAALGTLWLRAWLRARWGY